MKAVRENVNESMHQASDFANVLYSDFDNSRSSEDQKQLYNKFIKDIDDLKERYGQQGIHVLIAGEMRTGKSSLINAILGESICKVDDIVCTNSISIIKYGEEEKITVCFHATADEDAPEPAEINRDELPGFTSEAYNKNNKHAVRLIEIRLPNEKLKNGLILMDSPGLGSLNPLHAITTLTTAPLADMIIFVSDTTRELGEREVINAKKLADSAGCKNMVHVLTKADQGDPALILEKNMEHLGKMITDKNLQGIAVSTLYYKEYLGSNEKDLLEDSGYSALFEILRKIETDGENILALKYISLLMDSVSEIKSNLELLVTAMQDPTFAQQKIKELDHIINRLKAIQKESSIWRTELSSGLDSIKTKVRSQFEEGKNRIYHTVRTNLQDDYYLSNMEHIHTMVVSEITSLSERVKENIIQLFEDLYIRITDTSGLNNIKKEINFSSSPEINKVDASLSFTDKVLTFGGGLSMSILRVSAMGTTIGAVIGGIIGTFIAPGPGTWIVAAWGAAIVGQLGAIVGSIIGFFKGKQAVKEEKINKIMKLLTPEIDAALSNISNKVTESLTEAENVMKVSFEKEISDEITRCEVYKEQLQNIVDSDNKWRANVEKRNEECNEFIEKLNGQYEEVNND